MASATGHKGQALGLRLELARGRAQVLAGPAELAPGIGLQGFIGEPLADGGTRGRCRAIEARLEVAAAALGRGAQALRGAIVAGWSIDQVALDVGDAVAALTLTGPPDAGWPGFVQVELGARAERGGVRVQARRAWVVGPLAPAAGDLCALIARRFAAACEGVTARGAGVVIDPGRALRRGFLAAGARAPRTDGLAVARVRGEGSGVRIHLSERAGDDGQVEEDRVEDALAGLRAALRAGDRRGALAELDRFPAMPGHPGARRLARALAQVRAELLRFHERGAAALRAWLATAPDDPTVWWRLVVHHARSRDADAVLRGLAALGRGAGRGGMVDGAGEGEHVVEGMSPGSGAALWLRAARATVQALWLGDGAAARASLEGAAREDGAAVGRGAGLGDGVSAAAWRALAFARAADPGASVDAVAEALQRAIAAGGARPWCGEDELRARAAEVALRSGRAPAEAAALLRRIVGPGEHDPEDMPEQADAAGVLAGFYARHDRWDELVELLGRELVRAAGPARARALRQIAEVHLRTGDPAAGEQALRLALAEPGAADDRLHALLVTCLERQGRFAAAAEHAAQVLAAELADEPPAVAGEARQELLLRLARLRADLDDLDGAARAFEALGCYAELPVDGLETLARSYRERGRYEALAAVLRLRLRSAGEAEQAGVHRRLGELYDGPLPRPALAAEQFARAFIVDPERQGEAEGRARALLRTLPGDEAEQVLAGVQDMSEAAGAWAAAVRGELAAGGGSGRALGLRAEIAGRGEGDPELPRLRRELAAALLELGDPDAALASCLEGPGREDMALHAVAAGLLERAERWEELAQVCERAAALAGAAGDGAAQAGWLTRAAQACIDHAAHPRRAMHDARRLLLQACAADPRCEAARASLVPLAFAEHRWDEALQAAQELRATGGLEHDALIPAAIAEAWHAGEDALARAIGPRHPTATLRRLLWPSVARVALEAARAGTLARLDAILAAAAALVGSPPLLRFELRAWAAGRPLHAGVVLALARLVEQSGDTERGGRLAQLAGFMAPDGAIAGELARAGFGGPAIVDREAALEPRGTIAQVLSAMVRETGGIRAPGSPPEPPDEADGLRALADAEVEPLRAALGLTLPVQAQRGGPDGGVTIRNAREPAIVVHPALLGLPAEERRFRLALAGALIRGGLAIVLDPQGASLHELLAALAWIADPSQAPALPGAQAIVRAWQHRGLASDRFTPGQREALADELRLWRRDRAGVARLAHLLRRDGVGAAAGLSRALGGALRAIGRDARILGELDERAALQVLATEDAQWLVRSAGLFEQD